MQKFLYLIRHPDTGIDSNRQKPSDVPAGYERDRLSALANKLAGLEMGTYVTSDFERARQAAEYVTKASGFGGELYVTDLLREVLIWPDLQNLGYRDSQEERHRVTKVLFELQEEVMNRLQQIVEIYDGTRLCLFTHGNFIRCAAACLEKTAIEQMQHMQIDHLSITTLQYDSETSVFTLQTLNDTLLQE